jgi:hypothetical protein
MPKILFFVFALMGILESQECLCADDVFMGLSLDLSLFTLPPHTSMPSYRPLLPSESQDEIREDQVFIQAQSFIFRISVREYYELLEPYLSPRTRNQRIEGSSLSHPIKIFSYSPHTIECLITLNRCRSIQEILKKIRRATLLRMNREAENLNALKLKELILEELSRYETTIIEIKEVFDDHSVLLKIEKIHDTAVNKVLANTARK